MEKQDKRKFQLNKGADHSFDISKGGKRKFDLTKDVEESVAAPAVQPQPTAPVKPVQPTPEAEVKKNNKWLWIIAALVVIILLIWWLLPGKSTQTEPVVEEETIEEVTAPAENTDNVSDEEDLLNGADAEEKNTDINESKVQSEPTVTTPKTPTASSPDQTANNVATNNTPSGVSNDVDAEALKVIRGDYGIGQERKDKLGNQYAVIQRRVNELKREGAF